MPIRFQVDPDFYDHPKTLGMSDAATALWTRAGSYSAAKLLDGFIPEDALALLSRSPEEASGELIRRGLWRRVKGGFRFHQWEHRNLTRARVESDRDYERDKKRRQREGTRGANHAAVDNPSDEAPAQVNGTNVPAGHPRDRPGTPGIVPAVSVSVSESMSVSGSGQVPAPLTLAEPPPRCPRHLDDPEPPPCGACAEARRAHARWERAEADRRAALPKCRQHRGQLAHNCAICRSERLASVEDP